MFPIRQSSHVRLQSQHGVSDPEFNRVGAQDTRCPAMSVLYTKRHLQDSKLASRRAVVLLTKI
jgi:hypothetical protein